MVVHWTHNPKELVQIQHLFWYFKRMQIICSNNVNNFFTYKITFKKKTISNHKKPSKNFKRNLLKNNAVIFHSTKVKQKTEVSSEIYKFQTDLLKIISKLQLILLPILFLSVLSDFKLTHLGDFRYFLRGIFFFLIMMFAIKHSSILWKSKDFFFFPLFDGSSENKESSQFLTTLIGSISGFFFGWIWFNFPNWFWYSLLIYILVCVIYIIFLFRFFVKNEKV